VAFAELEEFLDVPLKKYSSGMYARMGFSVAIHTEPSILLVDEVLAVGDWAFHVKCFERMKDFLHRGTTVVLVSHNMDAVSELCQKTVLLNSGRVEINGPTSEAIAKYYEVCSQHHVNYKADGTKVARIDRLELLSLSHEPRNTFHAGEMALLRYRVIFDEEVISPEFGFFVRGADQTFLLSTGSRDLGVTLDRCANGSRYRVEFVFEVNLLEGVYHIGAEVRDRQFKNYYDFTEKAVTMTVHEKYSHGGWVHLNPRCRVEPDFPEPSGET
jgi:ABC-type glutathione transport system ATPase component